MDNYFETKIDSIWIEVAFAYRSYSVDPPFLKSFVLEQHFALVRVRLHPTPSSRLRPHRLVRPRTLDFHSSNGGSNPPGVTLTSVQLDRGFFVRGAGNHEF